MGVLAGGISPLTLILRAQITLGEENEKARRELIAKRLIVCRAQSQRTNRSAGSGGVTPWVSKEFEGNHLKAMRIAIPVWEGRVSPVLDAASRFLVLQVEGQEETSRFETFLNDQDPTRRCFHIQELAVDILICGAVSRHFLMMLMASGMEVIPWISGPAEDVLEAYLNGCLFQSRFLMPGRKRHRLRTRRKMAFENHEGKNTME